MYGCFDAHVVMTASTTPPNASEAELRRSRTAKFGVLYKEPLRQRQNSTLMLRKALHEHLEPILQHSQSSHEEQAVWPNALRHWAAVTWGGQPQPPTQPPPQALTLAANALALGSALSGTGFWRKSKSRARFSYRHTIPLPPGAGRYSRRTAAPISSSVPPQRPPRRWRPPTNTNGTRQAAHAQCAEAGRLRARDAPLGPPLLSAAAFGSPASAERPPRAAEPSRRRRWRERWCPALAFFGALPAAEFSRAATAASLVPLFFLVPPPTLNVPRLRCSPLASPFSSAWRSARWLPPGCCCALSASPPGAAQGNRPPHPSSASGAATGSSRIGGGEAGQGATRSTLGGSRQRRLPRGSSGGGWTAPGLPSRRGGASHLTTARA